MNDQSKYAGYWWLPRDPEMRIPGALQFSHEQGLILDLSGNLDRKYTEDPRGFNILGETSFGELVTVYQAIRRSSQYPGADPTAGESSFIANKAFIGAHFEEMDDAQFKSAAFQLNHLDSWLQLEIMDYQYRDSGFSVEYTRPEMLSFNPTDDIEIRIGFESVGPNIGAAVTDISFTHRAMLIIELSEVAHFNTFGEILSHLANLLALAVVTPVNPTRTFAWLPPAENSDEARPGAKIEVLLPIYRAPQEEEIHWFDMLFTYKDLEDRFDTFLENWFKKRDTLDPVFDLFFGVLYNLSPYPITTFLNYVQALETYHIRTMSNEVDPPEMHRERIGRILDAAPTDDRDWLAEKLGWSNRPALAHRLKELIDLYPFPVTGQAGSHDAFIKRVRDTRNYYTHYDPSLEEKAAKGGYLKGLSMTVGSLLEGLVLLELGFAIEEVKEMQWKRRRLPSVWF
ncbi:MAG: HEPN domain-containing protein [Anaerolineales bacterium]